MRELKKKCLVVMLPTNEKSLIIKQLDVKQHLISTPKFDWSLTHNWKYQHLYICSQEEIKAVDWLLDINLKEIYKAKVDAKLTIKFVYKIIATTDNSLWFKTPMESEGHFLNKPLPTVSESFIQKYIEQYNKGQQIKECMVEYEDVFNDFVNEGFKGIKLPEIWKPKFRNNEIIITKCKDSWSREEVELKCTLAYQEGMVAQKNIKDLPTPRVRLKEWLEENL